MKIELIELRKNLWVINPRNIKSLRSKAKGSLDKLTDDKVLVFHSELPYQIFSFKTNSVDIEILNDNKFDESKTCFCVVAKKEDLCDSNFIETLNKSFCFEYESPILDRLEKCKNINISYKGSSDNVFAIVSTDNPNSLPDEFTFLPLGDNQFQLIHEPDIDTVSSISKLAPLYKNNLDSGISPLTIHKDAAGNKYVYKGVIIDPAKAAKIHHVLGLAEKGLQVSFEPNSNDQKYGFNGDGISSIKAASNISSHGNQYDGVLMLFENGLFGIDADGFKKPWWIAPFIVPRDGHVVFCNTKSKHKELILKRSNIGLVCKVSSANKKYIVDSSTPRYRIITIEDTDPNIINSTSYMTATDYFLTSDVCNFPLRNSSEGVAAFNEQESLKRRFKAIYPNEEVPQVISERIISELEMLNLMVHDCELVEFSKSDLYQRYDNKYVRSLIETLAVIDPISNKAYLKANASEEDILNIPKIKEVVFEVLYKSARNSKKDFELAMNIPFIKKSLLLSL